MFVLAVSVFATIVTPRVVQAEAGSGGGGGQPGCSDESYSTCFGAVWRYYTTNSNAVNIPNVNGGFTTVRGCSAAGGFFAYVLVNENNPNSGSLSQVRSWKIGPSDESPYAKSEFFGGYTAYRIPSTPSDQLPTNVTPGAYSWYAVKKAFAETKALGQNSGFEWNGESKLGWFCYQKLDFELNPVINAGSTVGEAGVSVPVSASVTNSGATASSNATWQARSLVVTPQQSNPTGVQIFSNGNAKTIAASARAFPRNTTAVPISNQTLPDTPVGSRVCFVLSVQPQSDSNAGWVHSSSSCVVIAKTPKMYVLGGDVIAGRDQSTQGSVTTSSSRKVFSGPDRTFGSWSEYGVVASGEIFGMASGAGYSGGSVNGDFCSVSFLTISNAGSDSCTTTSPKGGYESLSPLANIGSRFPVDDTMSGAIDLSDGPSGVVYGGTGEIQVTASQSIGLNSDGTGRWVVINAPQATVRISSNIEYTETQLNGTRNIPQVVIIANRIAIDEAVTQVDAWLIARGADGVINTCRPITNPANASNPLDANRCNQTLTVNGPVVAHEILLYRTAGSGFGAASGDPAEVFNLRPDAYLWATRYQSSAGRVQTVYTQELPPRF